jgi:hypothetical protein
MGDEKYIQSCKGRDHLGELSIMEGGLNWITEKMHVKL